MNSVPPPSSSSSSSSSSSEGSESTTPKTVILDINEQPCHDDHGRPHVRSYARPSRHACADWTLHCARFIWIMCGVYAQYVLGFFVLKDKVNPQLVWVDSLLLVGHHAILVWVLIAVTRSMVAHRRRSLQRLVQVTCQKEISWWICMSLLWGVLLVTHGVGLYVMCLLGEWPLVEGLMLDLLFFPLISLIILLPATWEFCVD